MKLNNHGWGLRTMLIYSCILLSFLLVATYYINALYGDLHNSLEIKEQERQENLNFQESSPSSNEPVVDKTNYQELEQKLYNATSSYMKFYVSNEDTYLVTVTSSELIEKGYLEKMTDSYGNVCTGYSNVLGEDNTVTINSYITCNNYKTAGY